MRIVGLDVSRSVAEIAYLEDGVLRAGGRAGLRRDELERFAAKLHKSDHVVLEATGNIAAIVNVLRPHVARVAIANPLQVRLIAEARVKTDKIDAAVLAQLYASHFLPEVWMPDENTLALRRQVSRRAQLVRQRTRLKNGVHAVLAVHLIARCSATHLFGEKGRVWLGAQPLPMDERLGVEQRLRELDRLGEDLREVDRALAQVSISDERLRSLLTITGVNTTVAIGLKNGPSLRRLNVPINGCSQDGRRRAPRGATPHCYGRGHGFHKKIALGLVVFIRRIDHAPDVRREDDERRDVLPGPLPGRDDRWVLDPPGPIGECLQPLLGRHGLAILPTRVIQAVADQMHNAGLHRRAREQVLNLAGRHRSLDQMVQQLGRHFRQPPTGRCLSGCRAFLLHRHIHDL
ncbi:Transposase [Achromobacter xylosoxidans]|jgi:hypothetical protein|uniref:Transposase IS110-like N-terminal domain-containing protein n=1 Tax=Achromobacter insuavis TaxID=1287735 RepID=A0A6J4ZS75_9BURK|nr:hypothetical protein LMG26845_00659 [Achromobacter insuavis]CAB3833223.1 hypothetical protein LMG3412_00857 [Achromobacter deleyi]CUI72929.1 Transposase [Achromobacter xylosoxidans]CUJ42694.1 Transposase [Achromobacter sp. 2789STDY5608621]CUJ46519.1 Transposase [Achromobacter sp. 2789STDY5608628]CUJ79498.1 Transposase [Achromobacter sp. 2789STDY5608633]